MFKIYSDKINIIKTSYDYQAVGIIDIFIPLMSDRYNYVNNNEFELRRLINSIEKGDVIIFNSKNGISLTTKKNTNVITVNFNNFVVNSLIINKRIHNRNDIEKHIKNILRIRKLKKIKKLII